MRISQLLATVITLLFVVPTQSVSLYCPSDHSCAGQTYEFPAGEPVSFDCGTGSSVCQGTKFIISGGSTLEDWLRCDCIYGNSCPNANIVAFNSDLSQYGLTCYNHNYYYGACQSMNLTLVNSPLTVKCQGRGACDSMKITLVNTSLDILCASSACPNLKAYLYANSSIVFRADSLFPANPQIEIFLLSPDASIEDNDNFPYILHTYQELFPSTSAPPSNLTTTVMITTTAKPTETTLGIEAETTSTTPIETTLGIEVETTSAEPIETTLGTEVETSSAKPTQTITTLGTEAETTSAKPTGTTPGTEVETTGEKSTETPTIATMSATETTEHSTDETDAMDTDSGRSSGWRKPNSVTIATLVLVCVLTVIVFVLLVQGFVLRQTVKQLLASNNGSQVATVQMSAVSTRVAMDTLAGNN